jgi:DNA polymerase III alpha subunit (gram-positive type)
MFSQIVFFDVETGGMDPQRHPMIQLAAAAYSWPMLELLETLEIKLQFDPSKCEPEALELNSYNAESWALQAVPPAVARDRFADFCREHATVEQTSRAGKPYCVAQLAAYNAEFDMAFLRRLFDGAFLPGTYAALCVLQRVRWAYAEHDAYHLPRPTNYKLGTVAQHLGICADRAHDAAADVRIMADILRALWHAEQLAS